MVLGFEAELHTGNAAFTIHNTSSAGAYITQVIIVLGVNMQFDTTLGGAAFNPVPDALAVLVGNTNPHYTNSICGTTISGVFIPCTGSPPGYTTLTSAAVGYVGPLSSNVVDGATTATLNFTSGFFDPDDAWGFRVDFDTLTGDADPAGAAMNNASLKVFFSGAMGNPLGSITYNYGTFMGKKKSFPADVGALRGPFQVIEIEAPEVPEPAAGVLVALGVGGLALGSRYRRRRSLSQRVTKCSAAMACAAAQRRGHWRCWPTPRSSR